jgi:hypothetical protein
MYAQHLMRISWNAQRLTGVWPLLRRFWRDGPSTAAAGNEGAYSSEMDSQVRLQNDNTVNQRSGFRFKAEPSVGLLCFGLHFSLGAHRKYGTGCCKINRRCLEPAIICPANRLPLYVVRLNRAPARAVFRWHAVHTLFEPATCSCTV